MILIKKEKKSTLFPWTKIKGIKIIEEGNNPHGHANLVDFDIYGCRMKSLYIEKFYILIYKLKFWFFFFFFEKINFKKLVEYVVDDFFGNLVKNFILG